MEESATIRKPAIAKLRLDFVELSASVASTHSLHFMGWPQHVDRNLARLRLFPSLLSAGAFVVPATGKVPCAHDMRFQSWQVASAKSVQQAACTSAVFPGLATPTASFFKSKNFFAVARRQKEVCARLRRVIAA